MKLEKTMKQTGAFIRPVWAEVPEEISNIKGTRETNVSGIKVEVTLESAETHLFDGDEKSQDRLTRAYIALSVAGPKHNTTTTRWKTADNKVVEITANDCAEILYQAGSQTTELWF